MLTNHIIRNVPVWALPHEIGTLAHALSGRRFNCEFIEWFLPRYSRGRGRQNLALLTFSTAEFLINIFADVWMTQGQTQRIPKGRRKYQVLATSGVNASGCCTSSMIYFSVIKNIVPFFTGYVYPGQDKPDPRKQSNSSPK